MITKKRILIADDDPAILEVITLILEDAGYEIETTVDGQTVQDIKELLPDVILLDIWISGMDGRNICKYLKSQELTRFIPIIMISANNEGQSIANVAGADDFIAKPFEMEDLLFKVKKYAKNIDEPVPSDQVNIEVY